MIVLLIPDDRCRSFRQFRYRIGESVMIVSEWQARHDLTADGFQREFDDLVSREYRLTRLSVYAVGSEARYAGIWQRRGGNEWEARHRLTPEQYQSTLDELAERELRPTHLSVARVDQELIFAALWERQPGLPWIARHGLTETEYRRLFRTLSDDGYRLRCLAGYEVNGAPRYACIWDQYHGPAWEAAHGLTSAEYQRRFDDLAARGYRLVTSCGYSIQRRSCFAAIWEQSPGHDWHADHRVTQADFQARFDEDARAGFRLVDLCGYPEGRRACFTTIWEEGSADVAHAGDLSSKVIPFMRKWNVPGMSLSFAREGHIIASRCFGYANPITREVVQPQTRFRIASISKPVTAVAIFQLIEAGRLNLDDRVFGEGTLLGTAYGTRPYANGLTDITVRHLLQHLAGGWTNDGNDPMFQDRTWDFDTLITHTLDHQPLQHPPGTHYAYSNFGYCLLGRIIERVTGQPYEVYVRESVLQFCGAGGMVVAGDSSTERQPDEALYLGYERQNPYGMAVRRMDAHGGWMATAQDLLHFVLRVDRFEFPDDLLQPQTITTMTTPSEVNPNYACGWSVNSANNWWHMGGFPGAVSILVRTSSQRAWAGLCSTRVTGQGMEGELDRLMWEADALV